MIFIQITHETSPHLNENIHCLSITKQLVMVFRKTVDVFFPEDHTKHTVWAKHRLFYVGR